MSYQVRPRFQIETAYTVDELAARIKQGVQALDSPCNGAVRDVYATIYLPKEDQHYWSPQLSLVIEATEKGSVLKGLYGPRPEVWTMFIFFYFLIGLAIIIISIIGFAHISLDSSGLILWWVPVLLVIFLSLYLVSYFGQRMGHDQMEILHVFLEKTIEMKI